MEGKPVWTTANHAGMVSRLAFGKALEGRAGIVVEHTQMGTPYYKARIGLGKTEYAVMVKVIELAKAEGLI